MHKPYFPVFIDISEKKIAVVGGGKVAERRVETLLKFAERITVISPDVTEEIHKRADEGRVQWIREAIHTECAAKRLLNDADMVLAATNDRESNERIMYICREQGIPVNVSHRKEMCDFYFPAVVVQEGVTVGITSGGGNHKKAGKVREQVEEMLGRAGDL